MLRHPRIRLPTLARSVHRRYASNVVKIVEVGPRDGLQNERTPLGVGVKAELIDRLAARAFGAIEAGSFVSPAWVPQMAGTADVLRAMHPARGTAYPVLVPNARGLDALLALRHEHPHLKEYVNEIAIFTAATDAFSRANTNASVAESLARLEGVAARALAEGMQVRGYVSVVVECPYSGAVEPAKVREVSKKLREMGCYEVSLGDTVGRGTPASVRAVIEEVAKDVPVEMLAGHFHDTYGMGVANCVAALEAGVRTFDASVAGLGGCPYSPGATGNVATEDVLYMLAGSQYSTPALEGAHTFKEKEKRIEQVAEVGWWISGLLGRETTSRVGRAMWARRERERKEREGERAKL